MPKTQHGARNSTKPLLCAECRMLDFGLVWFKKQWICPACLNTEDYGPKHAEMSNQIYESSSLSWVN